MASGDAVGRARRVRGERPPAELDGYLAGLEAFFDDFAGRVGYWRARNPGYHEAIGEIARFYVPRGARVLEIGCGPGDLLASLEPSEGVGIDLSAAMVREARARHPRLEFHHAAAERLELPGRDFDYIVLSDLMGYLFDIRVALERLQAVSHAGTRIVINWYSRLWQPAVHLLEALGLKHPLPLLNWTTVGDVRNLLRLAGFETLRARGHLLLPLRLGPLSRFANRVLAHVPGLRWLVWTNWVVARPLPRPATLPPRVTVVCPCRNEEGNIQDLVRRLPALGSHTELIFVEGHSTDRTLAECRRAAAAHPERDIKVLVQRGSGKGDAVRLGFAQATGDLLMILDADLSVAPEDLPQFYEAMVSGAGEFVMGSRLVYAMDPKAMPFLNLVGNRLFGVLLSVLVGQTIKDTLCGTKAIWRRDYAHLAAGRAHFGDFDPYGDFDLIFGAAKLNLRILEIPVRYRERTYGAPSIRRFADGWLLLRMSTLAAGRLYFAA
ncbi:MAG TPA: glycosyltransferase [Candidatus Bathyarchaeia archaeon]|nr:glycosyltransferase [Candidatus Bathyarchaeia archaeon]